MGLSFYPRLKAAAIILALIVLFLSVFISIQPQHAGARANITSYSTAPPNTWEPKGFNVTGTAPWFVINTLGWNYTRMLGNVGIGNGSLDALNATGNRVINYTERNFMAADISMAPIDPARLTTVSISGVNVEPESTSNISEEEFESEAVDATSENSSVIRPRLSDTNDNNVGSEHSSASSNANYGDYPSTIPKRINSDRPLNALKKQDNASITGIGELGSDIALNDAYHSILLGRPVDDMLYQHPHGIATNAYGRLVGLQLPGGALANIGIRCLGYGY